MYGSNTFATTTYGSNLGFETTINAVVLTGTFTLPPSAVLTPDRNVAVNVVTANFTIPTYAIVITVAITPAVLTGLFSLPTSVTTGDANTSAGVLSATFTIPVYTLDVVFNIQGAKITPQLTLKRERVKLKKY